MESQKRFHFLIKRDALGRFTRRSFLIFTLGNSGCLEPITDRDKQYLLMV